MNPSTLGPQTRRVASQVLYQIFPDTFAIGGGKTGAQKMLNPAYSDPQVVTLDWSDRRVNVVGQSRFYGGDLNGIVDKLGYLAGLGVTGTYLTPIFTTTSNHKYDATDFFAVDPMFGGDAALQRLLEALDARGMQLTLDAVRNHVSSRHPWFLAVQAGDETKVDWFTLRADGSYDCWQGHTAMPELNLANPAVSDMMYRSKRSVVQPWLAQGVDNWRFDVAHCVTERFVDAGLLGEINGFAGSWLAASQRGEPGFRA